MADPIGHVCEEIRSISVLSSSNLTQFGKITGAETMTYIEKQRYFPSTSLNTKFYGTNNLNIGQV